MTLLVQQLTTVPPRETTGTLVQERFAYQAAWGISLILKLHASGKDYAVGFEFHDDVVLLDSSEAPTKIRFYQLKTSQKKPWTLDSITKRESKKKNGKKTGDLLSSHLGKLYENFEKFPTATEMLAFVSNIACSDVPYEQPEFRLSKLERAVYDKLAARIKSEFPGITPTEIDLFFFVRADLSLDDTDAHLKGKLVDFIFEHTGCDEGASRIYGLLADECRNRSREKSSPSSLGELMAKKFITRADVSGWLEEIYNANQVPNWEYVSSKITYSALLERDLRKHWNLYRSIALDPSNEAVRRAREVIRERLATQPDGTTTEVVESTRLALQAVIEDLISPLEENRLRIMILYEIYS